MSDCSDGARLHIIRDLAAQGCGAGFIYGAVNGLFFFDRYSLVRNVYLIPQGFERQVFSLGLALGYATLGTCAGVLLGTMAGRFIAGTRGMRALFWAGLLGLFGWLEAALYLNGTMYAFEWGRRTFVLGREVRAGLIDPRVLAANGLLAAACLAAVAALRALLRRAASEDARVAAASGTFVFISLMAGVNYRLPRIVSAASIAANCALLAGCAGVGWVCARLWRREAVRRLGWLSLLAPPALFLFLFFWQARDAKSILFFRAPLPVKICLRAVNAVCDPDRDFFSPLTPAGDCDNWNSAVNPLAVDVPGNGVDEDCVGGDFTLEEFGRRQRGETERRAYNRAAEREADRFRESRWGGRRPDIFFVVADALRTDHVSLNGYRRATTPQMDALFREGTYFPRCITQASGTGLALPSLLTSRLPSAVKGDGGGDSITLQRALKDAGYFTAAFHSITLPSPGHFPLVKSDFDLYFEPGDVRRYRIGAGEVTDRVERLLDRSGGGSPLFALVCYSDTHASYPAPPPFSRMFGSMAGVQTIFTPRGNELAWMELCYDRAIAYVDSEIGRLVRRLGERGLRERSLIVLGSDHGEEFYEHGGLYHGGGLHGEATTVPLAFLAASSGGRAVPDPVQSIDVMPTLLSLAGARIPPDVSGWNLVPAIGGGAAPPERDLISEAIGKPPFRLMALTRGGYKLIHDFYSGTDLLYNTAVDPSERRDLTGEDPALAGRMKREMFNLKSYGDLTRALRGAEGRN